MPPEKNRRAFQRLPASSPVSMWTDSHQWNGQLVNQSLGGIGLTIDSDADQLKIGSEVRVQYDDNEAVGFIRFIRAESGDAASLGIAWDQRERARKDRHSDAFFFVQGPIDVVCKTCEVDIESDTATFELWDGAAFTEPASQLVVRSASEREELLSRQNQEQLSTLLRLYQLGDVDCADTAVERVIDFEFTR